jgi:hypothetical protein
MASTWSFDAGGGWSVVFARSAPVEPLFGYQPCDISRHVFIEAAPLVGTLTEGKDIAIDVDSPARIATVRGDL